MMCNAQLNSVEHLNSKSTAVEKGVGDGNLQKNYWSLLSFFRRHQKQRTQNELND